MAKVGRGQPPVIENSEELLPHESVDRRIWVIARVESKIQHQHKASKEGGGGCATDVAGFGVCEQ